MGLLWSATISILGSQGVTEKSSCAGCFSIKQVPTSVIYALLLSQLLRAPQIGWGLCLAISSLRDLTVSSVSPGRCNPVLETAASSEYRPKRDGAGCTERHYCPAWECIVSTHNLPATGPQLPARESRPCAFACSQEVKEIGFKNTQHHLSHGHTEDWDEAVISLFLHLPVWAEGY